MIPTNQSFLLLERNYALLRINQLFKKLQVFKGLDVLKQKRSIVTITDSTSALSQLDKNSIFNLKIPCEEIEIERKTYL